MLIYGKLYTSKYWNHAALSCFGIRQGEKVNSLIYKCQINRRFVRAFEHCNYIWDRSM